MAVCGKRIEGCEHKHARVNELVRLFHVCGVHDRGRVCVCERREKSKGTCVTLCACRHGCVCVSDVWVGVRGGVFTCVRGGEFTCVRLCAFVCVVCVCVFVYACAYGQI